MKFKTLLFKQVPKALMLCGLVLSFGNLSSQTLAFPEATGFGRYTSGARGAANPQIYLVTNLNDSGAGSFRDAVSKPGRFVIFKVGGIINLTSAISVAANTTIAGQTATGEGIVLLGKVSFSGSSNTISRYLRIRYGDNTQGQDASGISNGANIILDHMTFTWGTDEVFSINWDNKGTSPDNITLQNCIIGQGLHRHNHSAGGLMQPSNGGKISLIGNLYICNKTRNNKIKGINEFVNNVVYNWGNYGNTYGHTESGDAYIMGGDSAGSSDVNIINNYFISGPNTSTSINTPFNRGNANFSLYGSGNYFDNNRNGILDGTLVPADLTGYPVEDASSILATPYDYPMKSPSLSAQDAYNKIVTSVGASYPRRDQVDNLMISDLMSKGTTATYMYDRSSFAKQFGFTNNGAGHVYGAPAPLDTDNDGMPDAWEDANGLDKNTTDALAISTIHAPYLNIEVYINSLINETPPDFFIPPSNVNFTNVKSTEVPAESSLTVNWIDNATNEMNNVLERSTDGTNFIVIATLGANTVSYNDSNLTPNTVYYYRIKATNATESSDYATASITTPPIPSVPTKAATPTPTTGFNSVELINGALTLKWTGSSNTTTYSVYLGTDPANLTKLGDVAYVAAPSYSLTGLSPATTYYWRIDSSNAKGIMTGDLWNFRALNPELVGHWPFKEAAGDGDQIADISSHANDGQLDATFDNATVRATGKANNAIDFATLLPNKLMVSIPNQDYLLFDKNSFTVSFWMKADASLIPTGTTLSSYLLCKGSMTKNATTGATGKRFNVEIKNNQLRFAIDDDKTKTELTSSLAATKYFTGDWVNVVVMRDVTAKKLRIYTNGVFTNETTDATGTSIGIGEPTDLVIGNIGALELYANTTPAPYKGKLDELKIFNYALSASEITVIYNTTLINSPSNVTFETNSTAIPNPSSTIILNWNDNSNNEANFIIERSLDNVSFVQVKEIEANTTTYADTDLVPETKYYYRLKATNKTDSSAYSEVFHITTPPVPTLPVKASNPSPKNSSYLVELPTENFTLTWTGNSNTTNYSIYFGTSPENLSKLSDITYSETPSYQLPTTLTSMVYYYWRVDVINANGTTTGDIWSFRINGDSDKDGVKDSLDSCSNTPSGESVNANGCSQSQLDDDNDGVKNNLDFCSNTPSGESVNVNGCSQSQLDDDNDGVKNNLDSCPNTPSGESVNTNGCSQSQLDDDNDGVKNNLDFCPNTPSGESVNANGCPYLAANNFSIEVIGETCPNTNNGQINITATKNLVYTATINGETKSFTGLKLNLQNLTPKTYDICLAVTGTNIKQCYAVIIPKSTTITGKTISDSDKILVEIQSGTAPYQVTVNDEVQFETNNSNFDINLKTGDLLKVTTAKACEGVFTKTITLFDVVKAHPNPTSGQFDLYLPTNEQKVAIEIYNVGGRLISKSNYSIENGKVHLNIEKEAAGVYFLKIQSNPIETIKIIKK